MKPFQAVLLVIFAVLAMFAVFLFATFSGGGNKSVGHVVIWGSLPQTLIDGVINTTRVSANELKDVDYVYVPEDQLVGNLVEAIAGGKAPDLVLFPASSLAAEKDKLQPISYRSLSRRSFQDTFVQAGETFLASDGIYGLPFYIDPYVTYWNRSIFSAGGAARAPKYWDEFTDIAPRLTKKTDAGTLTQSAVALGEWDNIVGAKDILVSLITALGNPIIKYDASGAPYIALAERADDGTTPAESALLFYTAFADPTGTAYAWNRSQPNSRDAFVGGLLGVYLAPASELTSIRAANPNLNFDVAAYPQSRDGEPAVPATLYALAIPRGAANPTGALSVAGVLSGSDAQKALAEATGLPSVRRDMLTVSPDNPYESIFRDAALNAFIFPDPDPAATDAIFKRMVENVSSGKLRISEAVRSAQGELETLIGRVQ